jgi:hypothetical protein
MTREEAIKRLKIEIDDYTPFKDKWDGAKEDVEALTMAIKSLEVWDKVIEEIQQLKTIAENEHNVFFKAYIDGIDRSLEIIQKHLGEVEE